MGKFYRLLLIATAITTVAGKNSVIGTIKDNTTWFINNLSRFPAKTASLEYHVQYPDVPGRARPIITFYYNGQDSPNLITLCETDLYGQLQNGDLAVPLNEAYREKFICYKDASTWICKGKTKIQDFESKSYSFSFCNECGKKSTGNLNSLYYNVTIYDESNRTSCVNLNMAQGQRIDRCKRSYQYAAIPNQIGYTDLDTAMFQLGEAQQILDEIIDLITHKSCPVIFYQVLCLVALPECLPEQNEIVLPCREYCESMLVKCLKMEALAKLVEKFGLNCKYLPSKKDNAHCFMTVDVCGPPLEINHGFILEGSIPFAREGHVVRYACNDSLILTGSPNSTCQKSGEWTTVPECSKPINMIMIICLGVGGFIGLVLVVTLSVYCIKKRKERQDLEPSGLSPETNRSSDPLVYNEVLYE